METAMNYLPVFWTAILDFCGGFRWQLVPRLPFPAPRSPFPVLVTSTFERESIVQCYRWGSISPFFPRNEDLIVMLMSSKKREQHRKVDQLWATTLWASKIRSRTLQVRRSTESLSHFEKWILLVRIFISACNWWNFSFIHRYASMFL